MAEAGGGSERGATGGRHARARALAERRAGGEELGDYERRLLEAHLSACPRCRRWAQDLTVGGGQEDRPGAILGSVESESGESSSRERREDEASQDERGDGRHAGSDKDAMGQDKRREVVGHSYGPSKARQFVYYGIFVAFVIALYIGGKVAVGELDKAPANNADKAPWSKGVQEPPKRFQ